MFFYYKRNILGKWSPVKSADKPDKSVNGGNSVATSVKELPRSVEHLSLDDLQQLFPLSSFLGPSDE